MSKHHIEEHGDHIRLVFPESENYSCDGEWLDAKELKALILDLHYAWFGMTASEENNND